MHHAASSPAEVPRLLAAGFEVRAAAVRDRPAVEALIAEMIPGCDVAARWRWLYETSPAGPALTWLAISPAGDVAGCTSFIPFRLWLDGRERLGALGSDGYVRPAFRRRGLGGLLHDASRRAMAEHAITCMYGAPGAMNVSPLERGGSRRLGEVARYVRPLRPGPGVLSDAVGALTGLGPGPTLEPIAALDPRIDHVWRRARTQLPLAAVRDAAFYAWRFRQAPAQREPAFVIMDHDTPIAACALELLHGDRELHVVDLVAIPGRWHAALRAIVRHGARCTRARTVSIKLFAPDAARRRPWASGFLARDAKPFLCMIPPGGDPRFLDPARWFYTGADSDLDTLA